MNIYPVNPFPNKEQEALLKAALLNGDNCRTAYSQWELSADPDGYMDQGSFRLLPLLCKNLADQNMNVTFLPRLQDIYSQSALKNQSLFDDLHKTLALLDTAGIKIMILKGAALIELAYKDAATRPMSDMDIMVRFSQARTTIDLLLKNGWKCEEEAYMEFNLRYGRSIMFFNADGVELDLHWHPFTEAHLRGHEDDFWDKAVPFNFRGISVYSLCPADLLLHVIVHGLKWNPQPPVRWVADALTLLHTAGNEMDWNYLLQQAEKYHVVLQLRNGFAYLAAFFEAKIPEFVTKELQILKTGFFDKLLYRANEKNTEDIPQQFLPRLYYLFLIYLRQSGDTGFIGHLPGFIRFLRFRTSGKSRFMLFWGSVAGKSQRKLKV